MAPAACVLLAAGCPKRRGPPAPPVPAAAPSSPAQARPDGGPPDEAAEGWRLLFRSGFEPDVRLLAGNALSGDLVGRDRSVAPDPGDWEADLEKGPLLGRFSIQYQGGTPAQRWAALVSDPTNPENRVLEFVLAEPNVPPARGGPKGRVQANLYGNQGLREFVLGLRFYLDEGFDLLARAQQSFRWLTLCEFWNNAGWREEYPFRVSLNVVKTSPGPEVGLSLAVRAQVQEGHRFRTLWERQDPKAPLPLRRWIGLRLWVREGGPQSGRLALWLRPEGHPWQRVCEVVGATRHPDDPAPDGFAHLNPMKLYTSAALLDALAARGRRLRVLWDDVSLRSR
ncbi:MAG: hypothetical protein D6731_16015 [Planctomycetota bacterium]|nr:MAG: hypothetical protein D6731_16015 [Planctomycetota bacterium]